MVKKQRARKDREDEAESGTPSSVDGGSTQRMKTPTQHLSVDITKRYRTRQSKIILQRHILAAAQARRTIHNTSHSQVSVTPMASLKSASMSGRSWSVRRGTFIERSNNSQSAAEEDWAFLTPEEINKFTSAILRDGSPDEVQEVPAPEPVVSNNLPDENAHEGSIVIGTKAVNDFRGSPSRSLNITELAAMLNDSVSDPDEVDSFINPSLVTVHGYRVKKEIASLLRGVISKYGDIAEKYSLQGITVRSAALEVMCGIIQRLESSRFDELTRQELESILADIGDLASLGLKVGWLRDRAEKISNALLLFRAVPVLQAARSKNKEEKEEKEKAIRLLEQKLSSEKEQLAAIEAEREKIEEKVVETKSTVKCFLGRSLVEGLL